MNLIDIPSNIPWLSLIWLSLVVAAAAVALVPATQRQTIRAIGTGGALVSLLLTLAVYAAYDPNGSRFQFVEQVAWLPQLGISYSLGVDGIALPMLLLSGLVIFTAALLSWNVEERAQSYWALLLLLGAGAYAVFMALDLFLLIVCYELTLLPKFLLIGGWGKTRREYGATKLALYMMAGSALIIIGAIAVYFGSGLRTFDMRLLSSVALFGADFQAQWFLPLFVGFAVLAGIVPLHSWAPTGHVAAPTPASMMLAGVMMKLGAYGCLRVAIGMLPAGANEWLLPLAVVTMIGAVYGALVAMVQRDFKFMVAYSSIGHMALALMGLAAGNTIGMIGAVLQLFAHGVLTALLFGVVGRMVYDRTHTRQIAELGGLRRVMPFATVVFVIGGLSSMGMPGLAGFWAEFNIFMGMWDRFPPIAILAAISIPITGGYTLWAIGQVFFGEVKNPEHLQLPRLTWQEYMAGGLLAAVLILAGVAPAFLTEPIRSGVAPIAEALSLVGAVAGR
jgi:NADH-quinone oxidoreductase subunit M